MKIEGGEKRADLIRRIIDAEIPVAGHIGLTPQSVNVMGGYKVQGKDLSGVEQLMRDAVALDRAGVACIYLEGIPREVAAMITAEVQTPTIGIGAGPECDGQVLVFHDLLNLTFGHPAKFVRRYGDAAALITDAVQHFRADVPRGNIPPTRSRTICRRKRRPRSKPFSSASARCADKSRCALAWRSAHHSLARDRSAPARRTQAPWARAAARIPAIPDAKPELYPSLTDMKTWRNPYLIIRRMRCALDADDNEEHVLKPEDCRRWPIFPRPPGHMDAWSR